MADSDPEGLGENVGAHRAPNDEVRDRMTSRLPRAERTASVTEQAQPVLRARPAAPGIVTEAGLRKVAVLGEQGAHDRLVAHGAEPTRRS